jgi:thiaminase/transcriptional activator TenA
MQLECAASIVAPRRDRGQRYVAVVHWCGVHPGVLSVELWADNADLARAALEHGFVRGVADGTLPRAAFQGYILQDAFFLEAFARAYALALARCPDREGLGEFFSLLSGVLDELRLHRTYAASWGVKVADTVPGLATLAYTDFLLATAALGSVGETCAAMTPCMRLYAYLGQSLTLSAIGANPYSEWINTYAAPEFDALAAKLEALLDRYASDSPRLRSIYRRAMALEVAFFDAANVVDVRRET